MLQKKELLYFRTKEDKNPAGVVPLNGANLVCPPLESSKKPVSERERERERESHTCAQS